MEGIICPYLYWVIRLLMYFFFHSVSMSLLTLRFNGTVALDDGDVHNSDAVVVNVVVVMLVMVMVIVVG